MLTRQVSGGGNVWPVLYLSRKPLVGPDVMIAMAMAKAYESSRRPLAERLMTALVAGDQAGGDHVGDWLQVFVWPARILKILPWILVKVMMLLWN